MAVAETQLQAFAVEFGTLDGQIQRQLGGLDQALARLSIQGLGIRGAFTQPQGSELTLVLGSLQTQATPLGMQHGLGGNRHGKTSRR